MRTVGAFEAKTHLSQLLDEVEKGATITITRHGRPVARLSPAEPVVARDVDEVIRSWEEYRKREGITLGGLSIREMIEEGRMS